MSNRGPVNPYVAGPTLKDEYGFYGRQNLVEDVVNTLANTRQNVVVLHGQRRIGKSSLLYRLRRDEVLRKDHVPIFIDMQHHEGLPTARILANLAQNIAGGLDLSLPLPTEADLAPDPNRFHRGFLPQAFGQLGQKRILLLIDEFDVVVPPTADGPATTDTFLGYLRALIAEEQEHLAFVFVVGQRLDLLGEGYQRLFKGAHARPVGRLEKPEAYELVTELGRQGRISYADEALSEIWALTFGHPYLTQLISFEVFDRLQKQGAQQATADDVTACLDRAMQSGQGALDWFWTGFAPEQQWVLSAVADVTDRQQSVSEAEIDKTLQQHLLFLTPSALDKAYRDLLQGDFLVETGPRRYQFAVELIRRWIVKRHPIKEIQRQIEAISPEALNYYQLGRHQAFVRGNLDEAIKNYRQALEHNPHFARVRLDLAVALRLQGHVPEAIAEYEKAYQQEPEGARDGLIDLRLTYGSQLENAANPQEALLQARRVLEIKPDHPDARQMVGGIHLVQIEAHLVDDDFREALTLAKQLAEPVPILQDPGVGQRVRDLWLSYSHKLVQHRPPQWDEAQIVLDSLEPLGLLDETVRSTYNRASLDKAHALLEDSALEAALTVLQNELKPPLPTQDVKTLLLDYGSQQSKERHWIRADKAFEVLHLLVGDDDTRAAWLGLYHKWGDTLLSAEDFDGAIAVYLRGQSDQFKSKTAHAFLLKAAWNLQQHQMAEAQASYQQAFATQKDKPILDEARQCLEGFFASRRQEQAWDQARGALEILRALKLEGVAVPALETRLNLEEAQSEFARGRLDAAFRLLAMLGDTSKKDVKALVKAHIQLKARQGEWAAGAAALKRLRHLLPKDRETSTWHANWLLLWAGALCCEDRPDRQPARAKVLCRKILRLTTDEMPYINIRAEASPARSREAASLWQNTCDLLAGILLGQGQACLYQDNLAGARQFFKEALTLPLPPKDLSQAIQDSLYAFNQQQTLKEKWYEAEAALKTALELGVSDPEIEQALKTIPTSRARLLLKADEPARAFAVLNEQRAEISAEERTTIKTMVYQFSRLYAGRNRWDIAREVLKGLHEWLVPVDGEISGWLDDLNREQLAFVKSRCDRPAVPPQEVKRLEEEMRVAFEGYQDAKALKLPTLDAWDADLIQAGLALGRAHLASAAMGDAFQAFRRILELESPQAGYRAEIGQCLYNYSERVLEQSQWDEAQQAMHKLKEFNLAAPDGRTRPDPRADGAIQRAVLSQAQASLAENQLEQTFDRLQALPRPWPTGAVKRIARAYSQDRCARGDWANAVASTRRLNEFLTADHPEARDIEALDWLIEDLEQWGDHLEKDNQLEEAAAVYYEALERTRESSNPRNNQMAQHYIRVALRLAQNRLARDPLAAEVPPAVDEAIQHYRKILAIPEHDQDHKDKINQAVHDHSRELSNKDQWPRAHQLLDTLDSLHPHPRDEDKQKFAAWRRELSLYEVQRRLERKDLAPAFGRLAWLKKWLGDYNAPPVTWPNSAEQVKNLVYNDFCHDWLRKRDWERAAQALGSLADLIAGDPEITGWEVEAFCQWGAWLRSHNHLEEAQARYEQALAKAPGQKSMPGDRIEGYLLDTQMAIAQQALDGGDLKKATAVYQEALRKPHTYLERADRVRQALKAYSDRVASQSANWSVAWQALDCLLELGLRAEQVSAWRQALALREMQARLDDDDLPAVFGILKAMERPVPWDDIQTLFHFFCLSRIQGDAWRLALKAGDGLAKIMGEEAAVRDWVVKELTVLGDALEKGNKRERAQEAFELAMKIKKSY